MTKEEYESYVLHPSDTLQYRFFQRNLSKVLSNKKLYEEYIEYLLDNTSFMIVVLVIMK